MKCSSRGVLIRNGSPRASVFTFARIELSPFWMDTVSFFQTISIAEKNCERPREDHEPRVQDTNSVGRRNTRNEKSPDVQSKTDRLHDLRLSAQIIKTTAVVFFLQIS